MALSSQINVSSSVLAASPVLHLRVSVDFVVVHWKDIKDLEEMSFSSVFLPTGNSTKR